MGSLKTDQSPPQEFIPFVVVVAAVIFGSSLGRLMYYLVNGRRLIDQGMPWWFATAFAVGALFLALRWRGNLLRGALILFAVAQLWPLAGWTSLGTWLASTALHMGIAILFSVAYWRMVTPRVKGLAVVALLLMTSFSYWTIHNWFSVIDKYRLGSTESRVEPSNTRLHPTAGVRDLM